MDSLANLDCSNAPTEPGVRSEVYMSCGKSRVPLMALGVISILLVGNVLVSAQSLRSKDTGITYQTPLGTLKQGGSLEDGSEFDLSGRIIAGFMRMGHDQALAFNIHSLSVSRQLKSPSPVQITLVQDQATRKWIATDGTIDIIDNNLVLVEGHTVNVLGGADQPFLIEGQPFFETQVKIQNGRPVRNPRPTTSESGDKPSSDSTIVVVLLAVIVALLGLILLVTRRFRNRSQSV